MYPGSTTDARQVRSPSVPRRGAGRLGPLAMAHQRDYGNIPDSGIRMGKFGRLGRGIILMEEGLVQGE